MRPCADMGGGGAPAPRRGGAGTRSAEQCDKSSARSCLPFSRRKRSTAVQEKGSGAPRRLSARRLAGARGARARARLSWSRMSRAAPPPPPRESEASESGAPSPPPLCEPRKRITTQLADSAGDWRASMCSHPSASSMHRAASSRSSATTRHRRLTRCARHTKRASRHSWPIQSYPLWSKSRPTRSTDPITEAIAASSSAILASVRGADTFSPPSQPFT
eukprot:scaffold26412_cov80-Isochrysis_galbana.AAC.2